MKTNSFKREMLERIRSYRNMQIQEELWDLLDSYDKYLKIDGTPDEEAEIAFYRGEAYFRSGRYADTIDELTKSLSIGKTKPYLYLEAQTYNLFGTLFSFVGYEATALENYLLAVASAEQNENLYEAVASVLNIGLLYQNLNDYPRALYYYNIAFEKANRTQLNLNIEMSMLVMAQKAQLFYLMERFEDFMSLYKQVNTYYNAIRKRKDAPLPIQLLDVYVQIYLGEKEKAKQQVNQVIEKIDADGNFMEQIDSYMEFCRFLIKNQMQQQAHLLMEEMEQKLSLTEFLYLRLKIKEMEIYFQKIYGDREQYQKECQNYLELQDEFDKAMQVFRKKNLENIELLHQTKEKRKEFEERNRQDFSTGLLNRISAEAEIREYMSNKTQKSLDLLLVIGIDEFKLFNDTYGHAQGEIVVLRLAELMKRYFKEDGICGRLGEDEFVVFLPKVNSMERQEVRVEEFREEFSRLSFGKNGNINCSVTIGIACNEEMEISYEAMLSCADEALQKTKEYGKNKVTFFEIKKGAEQYGK